jgi:hypothetical protein
VKVTIRIMRVGKRTKTEGSSVRSAVVDRHRSLPRIATGPEMNLEPHLLERAHHRFAHVIYDDGLHMVGEKEASHTCVMGAFGSLVVEGAPPDVELLPVPDPIHGDLCDGHPIRATPTRIDQTPSGHGNANHHLG